MWRSASDEPPSQRKRRRFFDLKGRVTWPWKRCSARNAGPSTRSRHATCARTASGRWRSPTTSRASTPRAPGAGSRPGRPVIWRYADFLPFEPPPKTALAAGITPLIRADRLAERLGPGRGVGQERRRQPHPLVQGPGGHGRARQGAWSWATRWWPAPPPATWPTPWPPTPPRPGWSRTSSCPPTSRSRRSSRPASTAPTWWPCSGNYDDVNRLCTELAGEREWAFVNVNVRPYYAEGSKTLAFEIAEQLGFELPDRVVAPIASGSLFTKIARGFEEWREVGLVEGELPAFNGAQAEGCSPVAQAFDGGHDVCRPVKPQTRSPSRWPSATRPTAPTRWTWRGARAAASTRSPTRRSATASACSPRPPASSPRPPAA